MEPDPEWYLDHVLVDAQPGGPRAVVRGPAREWRDWWRQRAATEAEPLHSASLTGFVLRSNELIALDVTRSQCRHRVRTQRWTAAGRGMIAPLDIRDDPASSRRWEPKRRHALQCSGAARSRPRSVGTGRSAAIFHGLPVLRLPDRPELTEREDWGGRRSAAHLYLATLPDHELASWYGIRIEDVGRTLVTLARHGRRDAIMAADAALREQLIDRVSMEHALETAFGWPWVRQARAVLALADPLAESPLESITRLALHDSGFPAPMLQVRFGFDRVDFYWPKYGLVLEADGRVKYVGDASLLEKQREHRLLRHPGVRHVERVMWEDVTVGWERTSAELRHFFR